MTGNPGLVGSFLIAFVVAFGIFAIAKLIGLVDDFGWWGGIVVALVVGAVAAVASLARRGRRV